MPVRRTRQREAIERTFASSNRPLAVSEVLAAASRKVSGLSLATVYRTIKKLQDEGSLRAVDLPGEPARYERREAAEHHHHHFRCDRCGRVYDIDGCDAQVEALAPRGFRVRAHDIVLYGACSACSRATR